MYRKNAWEKYQDKLDEVMNFAEDYKKFISFGKTERLVVKESIELLEAAGFKNAAGLKTVKPGSKLYFVNKNKNVCAFIIGKKPLKEELNQLKYKLNQAQNSATKARTLANDNTNKEIKELLKQKKECLNQLAEVNNKIKHTATILNENK